MCKIPQCSVLCFSCDKLTENIKEKKVGVAGFEPATSCSQSRRDNRATLYPEKFGLQKYTFFTITNKKMNFLFCGEEGIRTPGTRKGTTP